MLKVKNKKIIQKIAVKSFRQNHIRNIIAMIAIALTTILFTALFTVAISLNNAMEQQNMRMAGGMAHGTFKNLTEEQMNKLKEHPSIKEYGVTLILALTQEEPFQKEQIELRYGTDTGAKLYFSYPTTGRMPKEKLEIAMDTKVLDLLGIEHKIGENITISYPLGENIITETFALCGFWEADDVKLANEVWLSKEYVEEKLKEVENQQLAYSVGSYSLDIMFSNSRQIEEKMTEIIEDFGYTTENEASENYIKVGVNWSYTSTHSENTDTITTVIGVGSILILIIFTGYLIIYNVFQISVAGDIRFYGLLKTIGTTGKQIKRIIRLQALLLSCFSIPIGLLGGYLIGIGLTKVIISNLQTTNYYSTLNPVIFLGATLFSILTVLLSCYKPGKVAAAVSPIEAIRYVENTEIKKQKKRAGKGSKVFQMAISNMARNKKKTVLVIISLSLSTILFNATYAFTKGFDMDKFLENFVLSDFLVGSTEYYQNNFRSQDNAVSDTLIASIREFAKDFIEEDGEIWFHTKAASVKVEKETYLSALRYPQNIVEYYKEKYAEEENVKSNIKLYGLDDALLQYLKVVEGEIDSDKLKNTNSIIQIIGEDDYGNPKLEQVVYQIGDDVSITFYDDYKYTEEGELVVYSSHTREYQVIATVVMPNAMSTRWYNNSLEFAVSSNQLKEAVEENAVKMLYMSNIKKDKSKEVEAFIKNYTEMIEKDMHYESKASFEVEFYSFRMMFLIVGGVLSLIIGIVGILNYLNAEVTSIMSRRKELAMLQSIGMTGKQLKGMLILEGIFYGIFAGIVSSIINLFICSWLLKPMERLFWFFSYRFTMLPIIIIIPIFLLFGIVIPLVIYHFVEKKTIVERLREGE